MLVEVGDSFVAVSDEQPGGEVTGGGDMAIPVRYCPGDGVVSALSNVHSAPLPIGLDRLAGLSLSELG